MNYWVEKTIVKKREDRIKGDRAMGKALWSPKKSKNGADIYKNMRLVQEGDIIFHFVDNEAISGISTVSKKAIQTIGTKGTDWEGPAYLIELINHKSFENKITRGEILKDSNKELLTKISQNSEVFYNNKLSLRQGAYLTPCPNHLAELFKKLYYDINTVKIEEFESIKVEKTNKKEDLIFNIKRFNTDCLNSGLIHSNQLITRYIASLATKPFVLLSGLSGSGKTKLAQAFAQWITEDKNQYCIVPVGADWTNREPLLGYVNALTPTEYILPENGALELIINANNNQKKPYFLILDEMNLSHVERYFADFLSIMESDDQFKLHSSKAALDGGNGINVASKYDWPKNLFVVGTVNIDETTYMFSPKVLDRANVIEFRVTAKEMSDYFAKTIPFDLKKLIGDDGIPLGSKYGEDFVKIAIDKTSSTSENLKDTLNAFFISLQKVGAEFGYRTASEIQTLFGQIDKIRPENTPLEAEKIDYAIMQKLLPKLHGSRTKLVPVLTALAVLCYGIADNNKLSKDDKKEIFKKRDELKEKIIYPISLEKIQRMYDNVIANGFTSYAEA